MLATIGMSAARETSTNDLATERDYWRTLIDVTNAVVTKRDVAALQAVNVPNVRRTYLDTRLHKLLVAERPRPSSVVPARVSQWPTQ